MDFEHVVEATGKTVDAAGVLAIVLGVVTAAGLAVAGWRIHDGTSTYRVFRQRVGRAILLGLELLVAADIIRTVAIEPSFKGVGVLGGIVVIRTFLSFSLEVELEGDGLGRRSRSAMRSPAPDPPGERQGRWAARAAGRGRPERIDAAPTCRRRGLG